MVMIILITEALPEFWLGIRHSAKINKTKIFEKL